MTLRLYHNWRSSSSWRVRWAFALKRVECELMHVRMLSDEAEPTGHFARNPTGFVPVVEFVEPSARFRFLAESMAIIEWTEDLFPSPPLLPAEPVDRARTRQLAEVINAGTQPLQNLAVTLFHSPEAAEQRRWNRHWIERGLRAYEELVRETAGVFSMGDGLTLADLYLVPQCLNAERQEIPFEQFATVSRIYRAALATAECQATHPRAVPAPGRMSGPRPAISHGPPVREDPSAPATLVDALRRAAQVAPEERIICQRSDDSEITRTYSELALEAARVLGGLRRHALAPGAPVILQLDRNEDFIPGFWGCVVGGFVPVPVSTPASYAEPSAALRKLVDAWSMLDRPLVLAGDDVADAIAGLGADGAMAGVRIAALGDVAAAAPQHDWSAAAPDDLAVLLLTSGTTEAPRLVMRTHRRILAAATRLIETVGFSSGDVVLGWMPLDHGTGFARHVRATYTGCRQVYAPRESFMADPLRWLDWIERHRVTDTEAPNFAYGLVNARAEEIAHRCWDLSSIKFILNIAETIVERTAARFLELGQPHGLSPAAMRPIYGMSETGTLTCASAVAAGGSDVGDPGAGLVEVGSPTPGVSIRIVDAGGRVVSEGTLGRIHARDPMVTSVYYRRPDLDRALLTADGWVDTGDLGVLRDGRLTVTGREKDIIVVNGLKYGCLAIESTVEDIAGVEVSCTAALAHRDAASETDGLAIVFSPSAGGWATLPGLLRTIRDRVARRFGISPAWIVPLETDAIPRTASGKIQRGEIRARLTAGALDAALRRAIAEAGAAREGGEPRSPLERWLLDLWRETLTDPALGIHDNFFAWGGSSAKAAAIIARIADRLGVELRLRSLLEAPTVADLAARLLELAVADRDSALAE